MAHDNPATERIPRDLASIAQMLGVPTPDWTEQDEADYQTWLREDDEKLAEVIARRAARAG
ncbi:hypothetical protein KOI35_14060 [Actinoplanes bogorensis]|uniref:Uncharacterized protein n=1 Tax=Paractinoplanes bogorensis TaxID=1610840 RepID=A0ABS5YPJ9_9ACTN|nr:hypothetical protein [Actinoplanes bogorensis]MBU2664623.1 hypothetical protein [Actinoplanes bogorensis]